MSDHETAAATPLDDLLADLLSAGLSPDDARLLASAAERKADGDWRIHAPTDAHRTARRRLFWLELANTDYSFIARRRPRVAPALPKCCETPAVPTAPVSCWSGADHLRCDGCASWWTLTARGWSPCQSDVRAILERSWRMTQAMKDAPPPQWGMNAICEGADGFGV